MENIKRRESEIFFQYLSIKAINIYALIEYLKCNIYKNLNQNDNIYIY